MNAQNAAGSVPADVNALRNELTEIYEIKSRAVQSGEAHNAEAQDELTSRPASS